MAMDFSRLKDFLYERRNSDVLDYPNSLYKEIVIVEKDLEQPSFYYPAQLQFLYECAYLYNKEQGLQSIMNVPLPNVISSDISFSDFCLKMGEYQHISCPSKIVPDDTLHNRILRRVSNSFKNPMNDGWLFINANTVKGVNTEESLDRKLYLSVDNKDLHYFSTLLLEKCNDMGIEYDFKINNVSKYKRADNVVIYTSDYDFLKYISVIEDIKNSNPQIDFGEPNLLSYPYHEYIGVAPVERENSSNSYSQVLCDKICRLRAEEEISFDHFFENVTSVMTEHLSDTAHFCEQSKMMADFVANGSEIKDSDIKK